MAREPPRAVFACVSILLVAAVAGCSDFSLWGKPDKPIDPNVYPENYKKDVLTYLKAHPAEMLNVREASISAPALRQFGSESRFFACLRVSGPDWRKDKTVIFYSGGINQFIDAALASACAGHLDTSAPTYVSPSTFENLTCRQIGEEQKRITRAEATGGRLDGKPGDADDMALMKGAMEALEQVSIEKNCNIEFQHG